MEYYKILWEYNPKIVGNIESDQTDTIIGENASMAYNSLKTFLFNEPYNAPILSTFLLKKKAKLTDYISSCQVNYRSGHLISEKLLHFIQKFKISDYFAIPAEFTYDRNLIEIISGYYLFVIKNSIFSYVNFEKSRFKINSIMNDFQQSIVINSVTDIVEFRVSKNESEWHHKLDFEKLVLMKDCNFDIFRIGEGMGGYYVSEKLKETIEEAGFTGMRFEEAPNIIREE